MNCDVSLWNVAVPTQALQAYTHTRLSVHGVWKLLRIADLDPR